MTTTDMTTTTATRTIAAIELEVDTESRFVELAELTWLIRDLAEVGQEARGNEDRTDLIFRTIFRMASEANEHANSGLDALQ